MDVVEHGISRPAHASECMTVLFQELKAKSSQQKYVDILKLFAAINSFVGELID